MHDKEQEKAHIFDKPRNVKRVLHALYAICAILFLLDFVIHRHVYHPWEGLWGFYPLYGFVGCVVLVLIAKWMRTFLMRPEDYYRQDDLPAPELVPAPRSRADEGKQGGNRHVDA